MTKRTWLVGSIAAIAVIVAIATFAIQNTKQAAGCSPDGHLTNHPAPQSHRSYCVKTISKQAYRPGHPASFAFSIVDDRGQTLKDFAVVHEKIMHMIVVRKDLAEFQHLHPSFNESTGVFTQYELNLPSDGEYRVFADFTPKDNFQNLPVTSYEDLKVGDPSKYTPQSIGGADNMRAFDGYDFQFSTASPPATQTVTTARFTLTKGGKAVTDLENYLGALGHTVVLREGDLQFIHAHPTEVAGKPQDGTVEFSITFPEAGNYKLFSQFQHQGRVVTSNFVVPVTAGGPGGTIPGGHEGHQQ